MKKILIFFMFIINIFTYSLSVEGSIAVDSYGNKVILKEYKNIIVTDPAAVEIFYLISAEEKITAIAKTKINKIYPEEKTSELLSIGTPSRPSIEKILSFEPDLVILNPMGATKIEGILKEYNIPYFIDRSTTFDEIFLKTKIYGIFTGKEKNAENLIKEKKNILKDIEEKTKDMGLQGIVLYSSSPMVSFSKDTIPSEILKILKIKNMGETFGKSTIISPENILKENPDIIIGTMKIKSPEEIVRNNEFLKYSNAYKNNNIYVFESEKILRATPRIVDGIQEIYEVLKNAK